MTVVLITIGVILFCIGVAKPRPAVLLAVVMAVFEGVLRKWAFPEYGQLIYFLKDTVLLGAYIRVAADRLRLGEALVPRHPANLALAALCAVCLIEIANPNLPNVFVGLFGIKAYLMYVPLLYFGPIVFPDTRSVHRFWWAFLVAAVVPMVLGLIQFSSPADSVLNRYAWEDELAPGTAIATFGEGGRARITGTFSYITGYTVYLLLVVVMALALLLETRGRVRMVAYGLTGLALLNLLMTGSRGPLLLIGVALPILVLSALRHGGATSIPATVWLIVAMPLIAVVIERTVPDAPAAFLQRTHESEDVQERLFGIIDGPVWALGHAGPWGYGIGSTHQAASFLIRPGERATPAPAAEGEWDRIILEIGPLGFGLVLLVRLLVAARLWNAIGHHPELQPFLSGAFVFVLLGSFQSLVFNHTAALFYWFLAGLGSMKATDDVSPAAVPRERTRFRRMQTTR